MGSNGHVKDIGKIKMHGNGTHQNEPLAVCGLEIFHLPLAIHAGRTRHLATHAKKPFGGRASV